MRAVRAITGARLRNAIGAAGAGLLAAASVLTHAAPVEIGTQQPDRIVVEGRVVLATRTGPVPLEGRWVSLHRVDTRPGSERGSGPLDSVRTRSDGGYALSYAAGANDSVIHFVMASHGGIAYPLPVRGSRTVGDDAEIVVFDTVPAPYPTVVKGRHLIVFAPGQDRSRIVGEVFDIGNDSAFTVVPRETVPAWSTALPSDIRDFRVNPEAGIPAATIDRRGDRLEVSAPISPGVRQFSISYAVAADRFPLRVTLEHPTDFMEVLIEEPGVAVVGAGIGEVEPVDWQGRNFRRFVGEGGGPGTVVEVLLPRQAKRPAAALVIVVTLVMLALVASLAAAVRRGRSHSAPAGPADDLLHRIAALDVAFERLPDPSPDDRERYLSLREELKSRASARIQGDADSPRLADRTGST